MNVTQWTSWVWQILVQNSIASNCSCCDLCLLSRKMTKSQQCNYFPSTFCILHAKEGLQYNCNFYALVVHCGIWSSDCSARKVMKNWKWEGFAVPNVPVPHSLPCRTCLCGSYHWLQFPLNFSSVSFKCVLFLSSVCVSVTLEVTPLLLPLCNPGCRLCECTEAEAEIVLQLKNELREKELKLTDIRLEALSSAHHLDQIREAMNRMQVRSHSAAKRRPSLCWLTSGHLFMSDTGQSGKTCKIVHLPGHHGSEELTLKYHIQFCLPSMIFLCHQLCYVMLFFYLIERQVHLVVIQTGKTVTVSVLFIWAKVLCFSLKALEPDS